MRAYAEIVMRSSGIGEWPNPGRSTAITRCPLANTGSCSSQLGQEPDSPCTNTIAGPSPISITLTGLSATVTQR
jgi:hypothetical protein